MDRPDRSDSRDYWNSNLDPDNLGRACGSPDLSYERARPFYMTPDQRCALSHLAPLDGALALEVGCGIGLNAIHMASHGATVVAIDLSGERLRMLREVARRAGCAERLVAVRCAAEALPFRTGVFDRACSKSVLIHTRLDEAAAEIARAMKPGARAAFIEPMAANPLVNLYRATLAPREWKDITTYFTDMQIGRVAAPFRTASTACFYLLSFAAFAWQFGVRALPLFRVSLAALGAVDRALLAVFPRLRRFAWFAVIRVEK